MRPFLCLVVWMLAQGAASERAGLAQQPEASAPERRAAIEARLAAGRYADAETEARTWLTAAERDKGPESVDAAYALDTLVEALSHARTAAAPESLEFGRRAVELKRRLFGDAHLEYAESLSHYAHLLQAAMKPTATQDSPETLIQRALAIQLPVVDQTDVRTRRLITRNLLASGSLRKDERAARAERAVQIAEADGDLEGLAIGLERLAGSRQEWQDKLVLLERARALHERLGTRTVEYLLCIINVAESRLYTGDVPGALEALTRAEEAFDRLESDIQQAAPRDASAYRSWRTSIGTHLLEIADMTLKQGRYNEALPLAEHALAILEKTMTDESLAEWLPSTLLTVAHAAAGAGKFDRAFDAAVRSEAARSAARQSTIRRSSESTGRISYAWGWLGTDAALSLLLDGRVGGSDAVARAWNVVLQARGLVVDELTDRSRVVRETKDPELRQLADDARDKRQRFVNLVMGSAHPSRDDPAIRAAKEARDTAERLLAARVQVVRNQQDLLSVDLDEVAAALPPGTALVAYRGFKRYHWRPGTAPGKSAGDGDAYAAFVLQRGAAPRLVALGSAGDIHRLILESADLLEAQASSAIGPSRMLENAYRSTAGELRRKIWDPLVPLLTGASRVFIVPDGAIHLVNFAALPVGETQYLVEQGRPFHYLSAERHLSIAPANATAGELLAVSAAELEGPPAPSAAPAFRGRRSGCGMFRNLRFEALPWSSREIRDVSSAWSRGTGSATTLLAGGGATEADFKAKAPGKRVLHLATHGFFLIGPCGPDFNQTLDWEDMVFTDVDITNDNPFLLSGFAMAASDEPSGESLTTDDGVLTAEEIAAMNLGGVEWAVLSACDTGLGKIKQGEGMFGLRDAFQIAGVRTVIMSLWQIEDQSAQEWMQRLYQRRFIDRKDTADAVHLATLDVLRSRRAAQRSTHPVYWAGFVASGDWR